MRKAEKRHFCDPSLAAALLKATPAKLIDDLRTLGFLFESLAERDLRTYAESFDAELYHYQDYGNHEIDAVIEMSDGRWAALEVKLGVNQEEAAAENLKAIRRQLESAHLRPGVGCRRGARDGRLPKKGWRLRGAADGIETMMGKD